MFKSVPENLRIGGFEPFSTVDYPDHIAAVIFSQGCPFRCGYCHNAHLIPARSNNLIRWDEVCSALERRIGLLDAVVFSGGEPTAQRALPAAIAFVREMGFGIGLHTAGPFPKMLECVLPMLDWVGLDLKAPTGRYTDVTGVRGSEARAWRSLDLLLASGVPFEVRTTIPASRFAAAEMSALMRRLHDAGVRHYAIQEERTPGIGDKRQRRDEDIAMTVAMAGATFERFNYRASS